MGRKEFTMGVIGVMLVLGFLFAGCSSGSGEVDTWTAVKSVDSDLAGTWKGSETIPLKEQTINFRGTGVPIIKFSVPADFTFIFSPPNPGFDPLASASANMTIRMNIGDFLDEMLKNFGNLAAGLKDQFWVQVVAGTGETEKYFMTQSVPVPISEFASLDLQIIQTKEKIKIILPVIESEDIKLELERPVEIILSRE